MTELSDEDLKTWAAKMSAKSIVRDHADELFRYIRECGTVEEFLEKSTVEAWYCPPCACPNHAECDRCLLEWFGQRKVWTLDELLATVGEAEIEQ